MVGRRTVAIVAVAIGLCLVPGPAIVSPAVGSVGSLTIDSVTTTQGDELVSGVVSGQPVEVHLSYSGLGSGVHDIALRDGNSGETILNTTVVGDSGSTDIGVSGTALSSAYAAAPTTISLEATGEGMTSSPYEIDKVDGATFYLTDVPDRVGRGDAATVTYYGWTHTAVDIGLYADNAPLADNNGEDVLIETVAIQSPSGSTPAEFSGTVSFTPSDFRTGPDDDSVHVQLRESPQPDPGSYWGNRERIRITNDPPVADFTYTPSEPRRNQSMSFDASDSTDPDGRIDRYAWDFDGDGRTDATGIRVNHTFRASGEHTVALTVTDDGGASNTLRTRIRIVVPPTASFTFSPSDPVTDRPVRFDASGSTDPDGRIDRYVWDFDGDGHTDDTGRILNHTYGSAGSYTVSLAVTDDDGIINTTRRQIAVDKLVAPSANLAVSPSVPTRNETVQFDASGSTDPDGQIVRYVWAFGDGASATTDTAVTEHVYNSSGNFTVTVSVVDDDGARDTSRATFRVNQPPHIRLAADPPVPRRNETVTLDASRSTDPDGRITAFHWQFGDGTGIDDGDAIVTHRYEDFATYTVAVTAVDDDGARRSTELRVPVENRAPDAEFSFSPFRPKPGRGVQFDATESGDTDGEIIAYRWDFDGDGEFESTDGPHTVHTYEERGRYEVRLVVEDDAGATNATTRRLTVGSTIPMIEFVILLALGIWVVIFFWLSGSLPNRITDIAFRERLRGVADRNGAIFGTDESQTDGADHTPEPETDSQRDHSDRSDAYRNE